MRNNTDIKICERKDGKGLLAPTSWVAKSGLESEIVSRIVGMQGVEMS